MGIYKNTLMDNISPKIVVIGGLNRAGKTTLLELLRHMLYGFPKNLRESKVEHYVEGDLLGEDSEVFNLRVRGFGEPQITSLTSSKVITSEDISKSVDSFAYSKLFTITLDELKKASGKSEEEKLQSILLGAGLKDIVHIPKIIEDFRKEKEKIGGKLGSPNTKLLKNPYERMLEAVSIRDEALKEVDEYDRKYSELASANREIEDCRNDAEKLQNKTIIFEALKANFEKYKEKSELKIELESYTELGDIEEYNNLPSVERLEILYDEYNSICREYSQLKNNFAQNSNVNVDYKELLARKEEIRAFEKAQSGLKEKTENYLSLKTQYERDRSDIIRKMNHLNPAWKSDLVKVLNIKSDYIKENILLSLIDDIRKAEEEKNVICREIEGSSFQKSIIEQDFKNIDSMNLAFLMKKYLYIALAVIAVGIGLFFYNELFGGSLALAGVTLASIYLMIKYSSQGNSIAKKRDLELELKGIVSRIEASKSKLNIVEDSIKSLYQQLQPYKNNLEVDEQLPLSGLYQYFKDVQELKNKIINLGYTSRKLETLKRDIELELDRGRALLTFVDEDSPYVEESVVKFSSYLFSIINNIVIQLEQAEKINSAAGKKQDLEEKVAKLLSLDAACGDLLYKLEKKIKDVKVYNFYYSLKLKVDIIEKQLKDSISSERISRAFDMLYRSHKGDFDNLFKDYSSVEQIDREYKFCEEELKALSNKLEDLIEKRQVLKADINNLKTSEKLEKAQRQIDEARAELKNTAVKFAVYSAAEHILDKVQKEFMEKAKDSLLSGASSILEKITDGEIKSIMPADNLLQSDFKTRDEAGEVNNTVEVLSRGTGEQLFLAVRLNRIKEMEPKLPVILDDAFVNFDSIHTKNTLKILCELGDRNQVFILTCHPELLQLINDTGNEVQYWKLDKGSLALSSYEDLMEYLYKGRHLN